MAAGTIETASPNPRSTPNPPLGTMVGTNKISLSQEWF